MRFDFVTSENQSEDTHKLRRSLTIDYPSQESATTADWG